jgi:hypothetical protein
VLAANTVAPAGWDSQVFGDVQKWEPGKIKPHGDDLAVWGRAVIERAIVAGGLDGAFGTALIAHELAAQGDDHAGIGDAVFIAGWCGNRAVAVGEGMAGAFGTAEIAHG